MNAQVIDLGIHDGVELRGIEPLTYSMRTSRATNCATAPVPPLGDATKP